MPTVLSAARCPAPRPAVVSEAVDGSAPPSGVPIWFWVRKGQTESPIRRAAARTEAPSQSLRVPWLVGWWLLIEPYNRARLRGLVKDVVFSQQGRMLAVLVARDSAQGGGTIAFPYPGQTGRWSPSASYFGLPFVTGEQAERGGVRIDRRKFQDAAAG